MSKKVLHFRLDAPQYSSEFMRRGFIEAGYEYHGMNWQQVKFDVGILGFQARAIEAAKQIEPDLIFLHIQSPEVLDPETCQELTAIGFTVLFTFDVREEIGWMKDLEPYLNMILVADGETAKEFPAGKSFVLQSSCDMEMYSPVSQPDKYTFDEFVQKFGKSLTAGEIKEVIALNNEKGDEAIDFIEGRFKSPEYDDDICFIGSNYVNTNLNFPLADERFQMVTELKREYGDRFLYKGMNWSTSEYIPPAKEREIYNHSKIAICHNNFDRTSYFSDRIWRAMSCGVFMLTKYVKGCESLFDIGTHLDTWKTISELKEKIDFYLINDSLREKIAVAGMNHVRENHNWFNRVKTIENLMNGKLEKQITY